MLDSETPLGIHFIEEQERVVDYFKSRGFSCIGTPKLAPIDVLISKNGVLVGVAEIKSRINMGNIPISVAALEKAGGYLISNHKIKAGAIISAQLGVPYFVVVSLMNTGQLLIWKVTDGKGAYTEPPVVKKTRTMETVNGGSIERENAFLQIPSPNLTIIEGSKY